MVTLGLGVICFATTLAGGVGVGGVGKPGSLPTLGVSRLASLRPFAHPLVCLAALSLAPLRHLLPCCRHAFPPLPGALHRTLKKLRDI